MSLYMVSPLVWVMSRPLDTAGMKKLTPWLAGLFVLTLRLTCRFRYNNDPRQLLNRDGVNHLVAGYHAVQIAGVLGAEPGVGTMVSRSKDGELVVPGLKLIGHVPLRGSSGTSDKGGLEALQTLIEYVRGGKPVMLTVDGPRGPRGKAHKGISLLARKTKTPVVGVLAIPTRRWILSKTWDRLQIPKPFCTIDYYFSDLIYPQRGESLSGLTQRIEIALDELEKKHDPDEGYRERPKRRSRRQSTVQQKAA
jgi:lysophospholipid acyltransferase (LPLAT)-like uncharacterized protein